MKHLPKSPEAAHLRRLARAWVEAADAAPDASPDELAAMPEHLEFLAAAAAYGDAVAAAQGKVAMPPMDLLANFMPPPEKMHIPGIYPERERDTTVGPAIDLIASFPVAGDGKRWRCKLCKRDKFTRPTGHNCVGGYRKHNLKFEIVPDEQPVEQP